MSTTPAAVAPHTVTVDLGGRVVDAEVRHSNRARTTRIQLGSDVPLRIIVPAGASDEYAVRALRNKASWVLGKLQAVEDRHAREQQSTLGLRRPGRVWVHGSPIAVVVADVRHARLRDGQLQVPPDRQGTAVQNWYRRAAKKWLVQLVAEEAERLGVSVSGVGVRDQRTRWGSCSRRGHISLNWRLLVVPERVARYVVVHELVHLRVPNHSKAFWRQLSAACPDWHESSEWLARHGNELRGYDADAWMQ